MKSDERRYRLNVESTTFAVDMVGFCGGRLLEELKRRGGRVENFSCRDGKISLISKGISRGVLCEVVARCGGEELKLLPCGKVEKARGLLPKLFGIAVFCAMLFFLGTMVFATSVSGESGEEKVAVEQIAKSVFPPFAKKSEENIARLHLELSALPEIAFFEAGFSAGKLHISFLPAQSAEIFPNKTEVLSKERGVLQSLVTLSGTPQKSVGENVEVGDVLVVQSEGANSGASCRGEILVEERETISIQKTQTTQVETGEVQKFTYVLWGERGIFSPTPKFNQSKLNWQRVRQILPKVYLVSGELSEVERTTKTITLEEGKNQAIKISQEGEGEKGEAMVEVSSAIEVEEEFLFEIKKQKIVAFCE